jgi:hypothetical protein
VHDAEKRVESFGCAPQLVQAEGTVDPARRLVRVQLGKGDGNVEGGIPFLGGAINTARAAPATRSASWGSGEVIEQRLKAELASILKRLGRAVKADELTVVREGAYFGAARLAAGATRKVVPTSEGNSPAPGVGRDATLDQGATQLTGCPR